MQSRGVALVTDAGCGPGRQAALALAREGYDVAVTARTAVEGTGTVPAGLHTTAAEIVAAGVRALPLVIGLPDVASVRGALGAVLAQWGRLDLLLLHAAEPAPPARLSDLDLDDLRRSLEVHLHRVALVQAAIPAMVSSGGGTIVSVCPTAATADPPAAPGEGGGGLARSSAAAACGRIADEVNAEYAATGVRAFTVDPGPVVPGSDALGRCAAWLARSPDADRFLGRTVWAPRLAASL